ncbi:MULTISPECIES: hypothetical protein [unclassified Rhizobium]|uniref:hypothetical protein n=1 Tax=unclassified Rhizobium TaxID=2613769 RepID=UPI001C831FDC|nr:MULTISPECIES: hypothetical protein [unclassified Rhizobium]MBX5222076.1 hypothetical protein [Rhizobium sp. NLR8a]MBX5226469.1 hypothetical protein [Rhizobium sp. NLR9b]MBX5236874.1 hypothetical protein [Rhizobium sp. NLR22b]MBX5287141.1 hypothetical protein [Rhizobium sp. NLR10b]
MRMIALITMFLGWLVYGAMSAWAGCPTCASMNAPAAGGSMHHEMAGMPMPKEAGKAGSLKDPCASGNFAHMPLCAACLMLPAAVMTVAGGKSNFGYPAPPLARALDDNRPAPQAPPPRLV